MRVLVLPSLLSSSVPLSNFSSALHQFVPRSGGQTAAAAAVPSRPGVGRNATLRGASAVLRWVRANFEAFIARGDGTNPQSIYNIQSKRSVAADSISVFFMQRYLGTVKLGFTYPLFIYVDLTEFDLHAPPLL